LSIAVAIIVDVAVLIFIDASCEDQMAAEWARNITGAPQSFQKFLTRTIAIGLFALPEISDVKRTPFRSSRSSCRIDRFHQLHAKIEGFLQVRRPGYGQFLLLGRLCLI
jgi:hypothetical protein